MSYTLALSKNGVKHDVSRLFCSRAPLYVNPDHAPRATIPCIDAPIGLKFSFWTQFTYRGGAFKIIANPETNIFKKIVAK